MAYDIFEIDGNPSWWKKRTYMERHGIVSLVIAVLIILSLIISIAIVSHKDAKECKNELEQVCLTKDCVHTAAQILKNMDQSVNPCDDFYQFACGGFIKETEIPKDKSEINSFSTLSDLVKKQLKAMFEEHPKPNEPKPFTLVKKWYSICMNTTAIEQDGLTTIKRLFKNAGGWPILEGNRWNETEFDWQKSMQKFRMVGLITDGFIGMGIGPDPENSTRRMITLDQPSFKIGHDNLVAGFQDVLVNAYYNYLVDLAVYFGIDREFAKTEVKSMINFNIEIAKISLSHEQRRNVVARNNPMTITDLQRRYPSVRWLQFINSIIGRSDESITNMSETVNVVVPQYISDLLKLLNRTDKRDQANYAFFLEAARQVSFLPDEIRNREQQFLSIATGTSVREPRWIECMGDTSSTLSLAVGALYVRNYFDKNAKQNTFEMVSDIKNAFVQIIKNVDWMDEKTRKIAIDKAISMTTFIGYPEEFLDDRKLEDYYAGLKFSSGSYVKAVNQFAIFEINKGLSQLRDPINKTDWTQHPMSSIDINAMYIPSENSIQLPAGILQGVFFNNDRPHYMNYGAIAYIIGHEITHGFDDQGKLYDKEGNLVNWWATNTSKAYTEKAKCMIDQYSEYTVPKDELPLNGTISEGENIADNGGIKEAYLGYNAWVERNGPEAILPGLNYTAKQLFWISAGNCWCSKARFEYFVNEISLSVHSPSRYRVLIPFANTDYFAKDFNCPVGSKMNPKHKCQVW